jgi:hypothetical protein
VLRRVLHLVGLGAKRIAAKVTRCDEVTHEIITDPGTERIGKAAWVVAVSLHKLIKKACISKPQQAQFLSFLLPRGEGTVANCALYMLPQTYASSEVFPRIQAIASFELHQTVSGQRSRQCALPEIPLKRVLIILNPALVLTYGVLTHERL